MGYRRPRTKKDLAKKQALKDLKKEGLPKIQLLESFSTLEKER